MDNIAIVIVAYNRPDSIKRLLNSLKSANYYNHKVSLIISIDKSEVSEVVQIAEEFQWAFGEKIIIAHKENLGLRKHVISCGQLSKNYEAIIVLEDDIYVSPNFFKYVVETVKKYDHEEKVAGISLYSHQWNVNINRPFQPQYSEYDAYFLKFAQSWGQVWTKRMWSEFYDWYNKSSDSLISNTNVPERIRKWPETSWLKYFIGYIVETDKYFVYPYESLSTNFTDSGTHHLQSTTTYQVPINWKGKKTYNLPSFSGDSLTYDVFFELERIGHLLGINDSELCVDLYGNKHNFEKKRFWLTTIQAPYKIVKSYALQLRPQEMNVTANIEGNEIYLYDTFSKSQNNEFIKAKELKVKQTQYDIRSISTKSLLDIISFKLKKKMTNKLWR